MAKGRAGGARTPGARSGLPSWLGWGRRVPVALLLIAVAIAAFGAFEAFRSQRSHAATTASLLEDYGGFAAFTFQQRSTRLLYEAFVPRFTSVRNNVQLTRGGATEACLDLLIAPARGDRSCPCPPDVSGAFSFFSRVGDGSSASRWAGTPPGSAVRSALIRGVHAHARSDYAPGWLFSMVSIESPDSPRLVAYTLIESSRRDVEDLTPTDTLIYGFEVDDDALARLYGRALDDEVLLPPSLTRARPNDEVIAVEVVGSDGRILYASSPDDDLAFASEAEQGAPLGGGVVRASVLPEVADQLIIGGLPRDRTPLFVLIFGMAGVLAILAIIQLRREDRLALLRQDFVASVSHELRTPLAQVRLFTETLRLGRTRTQRQRDWALENIDRETHRLANLVDNILHFSRAERGLLAVDPEPGDLARTAREAIASFSRLVPTGKATISSRLPAHLPARIDGDALRQVLLNLLDNAVRYGPTGQTIVVAGDTTRDTVEVSVEDDGPGVPLQDRERIFEPFLRGDHTLGTVVVGSGIGLSVVKGIIEAHGGSVWVEAPRRGSGARFVFRLPRLGSVPGPGGGLEEAPAGRSRSPVTDGAERAGSREPGAA